MPHSIPVCPRLKCNKGRIKYIIFSIAQIPNLLSLNSDTMHYCFQLGRRYSITYHKIIASLKDPRYYILYYLAEMFYDIAKHNDMFSLYIDVYIGILHWRNDIRSTTLHT